MWDLHHPTRRRGRSTIAEIAGVVRTEAAVFLGVTAFFVVIGVIYWFASYEDAGAVMLAASAVDGRRRRRLDLAPVARHAPVRAEDRDDATIADGAGPVDVFPPQSVWPFAVGLSAALFASGFAFGLWLVLIGGGALADLAHRLRARGAQRDPAERTAQTTTATRLRLVRFDVAAFRRPFEHRELSPRRRGRVPASSLQSRYVTKADTTGSTNTQHPERRRSPH